MTESAPLPAVEASDVIDALLAQNSVLQRENIILTLQLRKLCTVPPAETE